MITLASSKQSRTTPINFTVFLFCAICIRVFIYFFLNDSIGIEVILEKIEPTLLITFFVVLAATSLTHYSFTEKHLVVRYLGIPVRRIDWRAVSYAVYAKQWRANGGKTKYKFAASFGKGNTIFVSLYGCPPYDPEKDALSDFSMIHGKNFISIDLPSKNTEEYLAAFRVCCPDLVIAAVADKD